MEVPRAVAPRTGQPDLTAQGAGDVVEPTLEVVVQAGGRDHEGQLTVGMT